MSVQLNYFALPKLRKSVEQVIDIFNQSQDLKGPRSWGLTEMLKKKMKKKEIKGIIFAYHT